MIENEVIIFSGEKSVKWIWKWKTKANVLSKKALVIRK